MLAYIKSGNDGYRVIEVEVGEDGKPILPEGAITTPPPEYVDGEPSFNLTIENGQWVKIPIIIPEETLVREARDLKLAQYSVWEDRYLNRGFIYEGNVYLNDARFREMLNSSIAAYNEWGELPKFWITADKEVVTPVTKEFLDGLGKTAYGIYQDSMMEAFTLNKKIKSANTVNDIELIEFPEIESVDDLVAKINKK